MNQYLPCLLDRDPLAAAIAERLHSEQDRLRSAWLSARPFEHVVIDDLLPGRTAAELHGRLPRPDLLVARSSLRQRKRVGIELERYDSVVGNLLFAFQSPKVVRVVERITGLEKLQPDPSLYASGLSVMLLGGFLNPHLDNSHDGDQARYRVLNLLYYLSPSWTKDDGGELELWDRPVREATSIVSAFNRLVIMQTQRYSWHSVTPVKSSEPRWCASNYYFADGLIESAPYRHVTTFAGRPGERLKRLWFAVDGIAANAVGKLLPWVLRRNSHRRPPPTRVQAQYSPQPPGDTTTQETKPS